MPIPSTHFNTVILLCELDLNCKIVLRSAAKLEIAAKHWIDLSQGIDDGGTAPPIDIVADCFTCLSAAAAISKMLFLGKRNNKKKIEKIKRRCSLLMQILDSPPLPALISLDVRNSWEHLDERLDDLLESQTCRSHADIHVSAKPLKLDTFVSRYFDPKSMKISFSGDVFLLEPIVAESKLLSSRIESAFEKLRA